MSSEAIINVKLNLESDDLASQVDKINSELNKVTKNAEKSSESQADASKKATEALKEQNKYTVDLTRNGKGTIASQKETAALVKQIIRQEQARAKTVKQADAAEAARENRAKKAAKEEEAAEKRVQDARKKTLKATIDASVELKNITQSSLSQIKNIALGTLTALGLDELFGNVSSSLQKAISDASSIVESENLLRATFNEGADSMLAWADASATAYGLTNIEAKKYLSFITGVLNNTGVANDALESMTTNYVRVVGDLASAFNTETADAFEAIRSGIAGNTTAMQRYGVVLSVANLQQFLNEKGISATYKTLDAASKQYVRYAYIMKSTADIQGDYTNTFDSFANSVKTLKGEWQNFLALVGQYAIPMLKPLISGLATVIAYAQEVIKYLAQIFGWEKYTSAEIDYSYAVKDNVEDTADAQADVTAEVKNTNKAMKQGVKLLDLYTLDFTKDTSSTSTKGTTDKAGQLDDIKGLIDDIDYNIPDKILPEIDIDMSKVKEIGDNIAGAFNVIKGVWDNFFVPFLITPIKNWLDDDLPGKIERLLNTALSLVSLYFGVKFAPKLVKALWNSLSPQLKSTLGTIGGTVVAAIGGWSLGKAIADSISSGEWDIGSAVSGVTTILGGVATGFAAGGPLGGAIAGLGAVAGTAFGLLSETLDNIDADIDEVLDGTETYVSLLESTSLVQFGDKIAGQYNDIANSAESCQGTIDSATSQINSLTLSPKTDASNIDSLNTAFDELSAGLDAMQEQVNKPLAATFAESLTGEGGLVSALGVTKDEIEAATNALFELTTSDVKGQLEEWRKLEAKRTTVGLTEDEEKKAEYLKSLISTYSAANEQLISSEDLANLDLKSVEDGLAYVNTKVDEQIDAQKGMRDQFEKNLEYWESIKTQYKEGTAEYDEAVKNIDAAHAGLVLLDSQIADYRNALVDQLSEIYDGALTEWKDRAPKIAYTAIKDADALWFDNIFNIDASDEQLLSLAKNLVGPGSTLQGYMISEYGETMDSLSGLTETDLAERILTTEIYTKAKLGLKFELDDEETEKSLNNAIEYFKTDTSRITEKGAGWGTWSIVGDALRKSATDAGFTASTLDDGVVEVTSKYDFKSLFETVPVNQQEVKDAVDKLTAPLDSVNKTAKDKAKEGGTAASEAFRSSYSESVESEDTTSKITDSVESGLTSALEDVETPAEAKVKGTDLAKSITSGMTDGFNTALAPESEFMKASEDLTNTLVNIPTKFETAFKNTINNIADYINSLVNSLKEQTSKLNLSSDNVTLGQLYNALTTSNFKIPALANGGVIPPGNPFLAVLGDQRRGMNVEAPVTVIRDAVRDVIQDTGTQTPVEVKVYIGDREIRDFVVDTITANNLIVG